MVKCYDCGRRYDYDEDGFCPNCGGFNQPVRASRIDADGNLVRSDGINEQNHAGSFVHKEYHAEERKRRGTPLEQTADRTRRAKTVKTFQPAPIIKSVSHMQKSKTSSGVVIAAVIWIFILVIQIILNIAA